MIGAITVDALADTIAFFEALPDIAEQAAVYAINDVTERDALKGIREQMRKEVDFPAGYLEGDRLRVSQRARKGKLEAAIRGRDRGTSLARFAAGQTPGNTRGHPIKVKVKPGQTRVLKNGFIVNLRNGNRGLAVRLKPGDTLRKSDGAVRLADNVYLLYGPSVDQVFKGVANDQVPAIGAALSRQFLRQFTRLSSGKR